MADKLNSEFENVAKQFIQHYYTTFAADRKSLGPLYGENSMLTWEDERVQGATNIVNKLSQLNFAKVWRVRILSVCPASTKHERSAARTLVGGVPVAVSSRPARIHQLEAWARKESLPASCFLCRSRGARRYRYFSDLFEGFL
eukprot:GHVU01055202.1.p1 GENE.GHVU01055202.1~~GHVU01055202.1.p1  ORF type:complete len:143 (-),score=6.75 GHVU01055202.1:956-1384(-)